VMTGSERAIILVSPTAALDARPRLFAALEAAFPIRFRGVGSDARDAVGLITVGPEGTMPPADRLMLTLPTFAVAGGPPGSTTREEFTLHRVGGVDRRLHGITLSDHFTAPQFGDVPGSRGNEDVLATTGSEAVWTVSRGPVPVHHVRSTLPELRADEVLYALLTKRQLSAVAVVQFLREASGTYDLHAAPLRASYLFDDPNLRWRSYGFIDYEHLVRHADEHGYHAAMAMIPLDAGWPHRPTADLFRRRSDRLSLIVHGNDHTKAELLATHEDHTAQSIAAQAVRRIRRFERRCGLSVDRVMAPPHGLCSMSMTRALGSVGFDALTAIHPLPWTERPPAEPCLAGWRPGDFVGGCAVIPRIPLGSSAADLGLRAFLDHPLVVYGHHDDLADGLDALAETAATINRLGEVRWTSVGEIVAGNFEQRLDGDHLRVRPFAREIRLPIDPEVATLTIEHPGDSVDDGSLLGFSIDAAASRLAFGVRLPLPEHGRKVLQIRLRGANDVDPDLVPAPAWRPWPKLRRVVTEMRDRASARPGSGLSTPVSTTSAAGGSAT